MEKDPITEQTWKRWCSERPQIDRQEYEEGEKFLETFFSELLGELYSAAAQVKKKVSKREAHSGRFWLPFHWRCYRILNTVASSVEISPAVQLAHLLLTYTIKVGGLGLAIPENRLQIRDVPNPPYIKMDGMNFRADSYTFAPHVYPILIDCYKGMAGIKPAQSRMQQEGRFAFAFWRRIYHVRVHSLPVSHGEIFTLDISP